MFTVEHEYDSTIVVIMDEKGEVEDFHAILDDRWVYLRQFNEKTNQYEVIKVKVDMISEFITALTKPEGLYGNSNLLQK